MMLNFLKKLLFDMNDYEVFPTDYQIIKEGNKSFWHKHSWYEVEWDKNFGNNYSPHDGQFVATCKYLLECNCGAQRIMTRKEFI